MPLEFFAVSWPLMLDLGSPRNGPPCTAGGGHMLIHDFQSTSAACSNNIIFAPIRICSYDSSFYSSPFITLNMLSDMGMVLEHEPGHRYFKISSGRLLSCHSPLELSSIASCQRYYYYSSLQQWTHRKIFLFC